MKKIFLVPVLISVVLTYLIALTIVNSQPVSFDQTTGFGTAATYAATNFMSSTNNLAEVSAAGPAAQSASRANLGLTGMATSNPTINSGVSRSLVSSTSATGFQVSSTGMSWVAYSVTTTTTATIGGSSSGLVYLEICPTNSTTPSNWITICSSGNSQAITLAIALQSVQTTTGILSAMVPTGYYVRLRSSSISGSPSFAYNSGTEVLF